MIETKISLCNNVQAIKVSSSISIGELVKITVNQPRLKQDTETARVALQAGNKEEYDRIKKLMPAVTPHALFSNERKDNSPHTLTDFIMIDIDHNENPTLLIENAKKIASVILACKSLSGNGVHLLIKYSPGNDNDFKTCYKAVMQGIEIRLKTQADGKCNNISRLMIINHDQDVYYNPEAIPLDMAGILWLENNPFTNFEINNEMNQEQQLHNYLDKAGPHLNWVVGNRHSTLVSLANCLNQAGFDENDVIKECTSRYTQPGFDHKEISDTIRAIYKNYASQHGTKQNSPSVPKDKWTNRQLDYSLENAEDLFDDEVLLSSEYPNIEDIKEYIPSFFYDYGINPKRSKEVQFTTGMSILVAFGAMMKEVTCLLKRGEEVTPFIYYYVGGAAASGKSCIGLGNEIFKNYAEKIENESKEEISKKKKEHKTWEKCQKECQKIDCGCGAEPIVPQPVKLRMSLNVSSSKLIHHLANNGSFPCLLYSSEVEANLDMKENPLSPTLRAAYEGEYLSNNTHMHGDVSKDNPKLCILAAGTPAQWTKFIKNKENGLASRFIGNFLSDSTYEGLTDEGDIDYKTFRNQLERFQERVKTFAQYAMNKKIDLKLTPESRSMIDSYFVDAEERYARFASDAVNSFIRRLRKTNVRLSMILTVLDLFEKDLGAGTYDIPNDIVAVMLSWNDFWIEQHIRLLSLLPETSANKNSFETKYAHLFDKLPCKFTLKQACKTLKPIQEVYTRTMQRVLKKWIEKGFLRSEHNCYYKVNCQESALDF